MMTLRKAMWFMGLAGVAVAMAGCAPHAQFEIAIDVRPTITAAHTATPTVVYTPTPRPTATETATPSPTPESFPVEKAKLFNNMPKSYDELTANLGNYVEAPDATTPEFLDWWKNKLLPALGPEADLPRNAEVLMDQSSIDRGVLVLHSLVSRSLLSPPPFFYFQHHDKVYPVLVLSTVAHLAANAVSNGTATVILTEDTQYQEGWDSLALLAEGKPVISVQLYPGLDAQFMPADCPEFIAAGLDGSVYYEPGSTPEPIYNSGGHYWWIPACGRIQTSIPK